jgi:HEAT repeat protein
MPDIDHLIRDLAAVRKTTEVVYRSNHPGHGNSYPCSDWSYEEEVEVEVEDAVLQSKAAQSLIELGEPAVLPLIVVLKTDLHRAAWAARILGEIKDPRAVVSLCEVLKSGRGPDEEAAEALGKIGDVRAVEPLCEVLERKLRPASGVEWQAALALGKIGSERAVSTLCKALKSDLDRHVRLTVAEALGEIAQRTPVAELRQALPPLHQLLRFWSGEDREAKRVYRTVVRQIEATIGSP